MCFNAAKSWELGWYSARHKTLTPNRSDSYKGELVSFLRNPNYSRGGKMIIKLNASDNRDYFINFNLARGFNSGTREGRNQVLIVDGANGRPSNLVAKLGEGDTWYKKKDGRKFYVKVKNIYANTESGYATVEITTKCVGLSWSQRKEWYNCKFDKQ